MSKLTDDLLNLQSLVRLGEVATPEQRAQIDTLRADIPAPIAAHFFRQLTNGRRGIAVVRNGVCGECHLRLPHSMVHMLARANELLVCENCGAFVMLAPEDKATVIAQSAQLKTKPRVVRKRAAVAA